MAAQTKPSLIPFLRQVSTFYKENGILGGLLKFAKLGETAVGDLKGVDQFGNKYYENDAYMSGRTRWVVYRQWDFEPSSVPPRWNAWLHSTSDDTPLSKPVYIPKYVQSHLQNNLSNQGSNANYLPPGALLREDQSIPQPFKSWKNIIAKPGAEKTMEQTGSAS